MIHIFYRHTNLSGRAGYRPEWFDYESCFINLLKSIEPYEKKIRINIILDGKLDDNPLKKYSDRFTCYEIHAGSDKNSFYITLDLIKDLCVNNEIGDNDIIYLLENDYLHVYDWVPKVVNIFDKFNDKYVSLYDHADKYFDGNYINSKIYVTKDHHWRTTPSTCGSFFVSKKTFIDDFDINRKISDTCYDIGTTPDHYRFLIMNLYKKREVLTPIPGLSTHVMNNLMSPVVDWKKINYNFKDKIKVCLFDHHNYPIPTDGIGGVIGMFQILYNELQKYDFEITLIVNDGSSVMSSSNMEVIKLPFEEIENLRFGRTPVSKYFQRGIFYSNSSGRHVNFDFNNFFGKWIAVCQGSHEYVGNADLQVFVSQNQLHQHLRDRLLDSPILDYKVVYNAIDKSEYYWQDGPHDRIVWIGRIDGAKAERLYDIALRSPEKILAAGWYSPEWKWLFDKIMSTGNVEWVGRIDGAENKRHFFSRAKINIHCSTFEDPCPLTVLESQACGIPVLSFANGSMSEICYLKELVCGNLDELISKINHDYYTENKQKIIEFITNNFTSESYGKRWRDIFNQISSC